MHKNKFARKLACFSLIGMTALSTPLQVQADTKISSDVAIAGITPVMEEYFDTNTDSDISSMKMFLLMLLQEHGINELKMTEIVSPYANLGISIAETFVNIRSEPNTESEVVGRLYHNCATDILEVVDDWVKIESGDVKGYIKSEYLAIGPEAEELINEAAEKYAVIKTQTLFVRQEPNLESSVVTMVPIGERYYVEEEQEEWAKILIDDITGYVSKSYVDIEIEFDYAISIEEEMARIAAEEAARRAEEERLEALAREEAERVEAERQAKIEEENRRKAEENKKKEATKSYKDVSGDRYAKVSLNVRSGPATSHEKTGILSKGQNVSITKAYNNGWYEISYGGNTGFVLGSYLTESKPVVETEAPTQTQAPTSEAEAETKETETQTEAKTEAPTKAESKPQTSSGKGQEIANYALKFVGNPYVYGGTSLTNGADCSGFTQSVFKHFGYSIPRVSYDQAKKAGRKINISDRQPGDLVCYSGHVGIYIGNDKVVHASNKKTGIKVSTYNYRNIVCIRRVAE